MLRTRKHSDGSSFETNKRKCFYTPYNCGTHCFRVETKIKMNQEKDYMSPWRRGSLTSFKHNSTDAASVSGNPDNRQKLE